MRITMQASISQKTEDQTSSNTRVCLRPLQIEDILIFSNFAQREISNFEFFDDSARKTEKARYTQKACLEILNHPSNTVLLATYGSDIVGFIHAFFEGGVAWLNWVCVDKSYRKKNVPWYLWRRLFLELKAKGVHKIWGVIRRQNIVACDMAQKIGFTYLTPLSNFWYGYDYILVAKVL